MDLIYTTAQSQFRQEVRDWLKAHIPATPLPSFDTAEGFAAHREWEKTLARGNFGMVTWPKEYGGRGCDLIEWLIFEEEYYRAGAPLRVNQNGIFLLGPTLMEYGTAEQKKRFISQMASGAEMWAQGWSEPGAGSDMAAIRCRADRDCDEYVINGQKIWSTAQSSPTGYFVYCAQIPTPLDTMGCRLFWCHWTPQVSPCDRFPSSMVCRVLQKFSLMTCASPTLILSAKRGADCQSPWRLQASSAV